MVETREKSINQPRCTIYGRKRDKREKEKNYFEFEWEMTEKGEKNQEEEEKKANAENIVKASKEKGIHIKEKEKEEQKTREQETLTPQNTPSRGRGRPRLERSGQRGRPRKIYQPGNKDEQENKKLFLSEVTFKEALEGPHATEWKSSTSSEMRSIVKKDT